MARKTVEEDEVISMIAAEVNDGDAHLVRPAERNRTGADCEQAEQTVPTVTERKRK